MKNEVPYTLFILLSILSIFVRNGKIFNRASRHRLEVNTIMN
ncbi:hypothetical protein HMPREF0663_12317 [Hoylesella oralis ATCC 33269]|uniref:Uncharacterized protein n=1 Tax=Hoylesella oralis ATCC 33269 TaxID=873533 RepID=E7RSP9_9BACT|nr:hypothetical protein HMPREF0663_12317 [Hoylesella oralis ATCC 33269]